MGRRTARRWFCCTASPMTPQPTTPCPPLVAAGRRVIVPYLRGYGPTRFLAAETPRSGQQAALGRDLLDLLDALAIPRAALAGYDWGGRAACVVAALWPERCGPRFLHRLQHPGHRRLGPPGRRSRSTATGTSTTSIPSAAAPACGKPPRICRLLWRLWSPDWDFDDATFAASAAAFDNPDFVDVVSTPIATASASAPATRRSTRSRRRWPPSRASRCRPSRRMARPTASGRSRARPATPLLHRPPERRVIPRVGHNPPQEAPEAFARCILDLPQ